jgi:alpha-L-fucosidase 2
VAVWTPDYRLINHAPWPACLDDVETAARWILETRDLPLPPPRERELAIGGFSAGAHLALMLGLTRLRGTPQCLVAGAPPTVLGPDLYSHARDIFSSDFGTRFFGRSPLPEHWRAASPLAQIDAAPLPPLLLVHNLKDYLVPVFHSRAMAIRYRREGGHCRTCFFEGLAPSHDIMSSRRADSLAGRTLKPIVLNTIRAFLSDYFR